MSVIILSIITFLFIYFIFYVFSDLWRCKQTCQLRNLHGNFTDTLSKPFSLHDYSLLGVLFLSSTTSVLVPSQLFVRVSADLLTKKMAVLLMSACFFFFFTAGSFLSFIIAGDLWGRRQTCLPSEGETVTAVLQILTCFLCFVFRRWITFYCSVCFFSAGSLMSFRS